jgi:hypothetical protein
MPRGVSPVDEARLQGRLWTPAFEQPAVWLDASDISTITIATGVSEWRDKSGNGANATQATAANQPAYSPVEFSGLPGITTDGVNDSLGIVTTLSQGNLTHAVYWVMRVIGAGSGVDGYRPLIGVRPSASQDIGALIYRNPSGLAASYPYFGQPTNGFFDSGPAIAANNTSNIFGFQLNGTGWGAWQNGILVGTTSPAAGAPNTVNSGFALGSQPPPANRFTNAIYAEVLGFSFATTLTRLRMEGYLAWKWNLVANLPAAHPFKNRPPLIGD